VQWKQKVTKLGQDEHTAGVILAESMKGYDLLVVRASTNKGGRGLFGQVVDRLIVESQCNVFVLWHRWG
jgi:nucleotide-binding universal stress UspA family protein